MNFRNSSYAVLIERYAEWKLVAIDNLPLLTRIVAEMISEKTKIRDSVILVTGQLTIGAEI